MSRYGLVFTMAGIAVVFTVVMQFPTAADRCAHRYSALMLQRSCLALPNCHNTVEGIAKGQADKAYIAENCPKEAAEDAVWGLMQGTFEKAPHLDPQT